MQPPPTQPATIPPAPPHGLAPSGTIPVRRARRAPADSPVQPWTPAQPAEARDLAEAHSPAAARARADRWNLGLILLGFLAVLLLIPPAHAFPVIDDWIYAASVRDMLATGHFTMPDWSQANLVGLTLWGVLWTRVFGFSLTVLTYSTLALALGGLFAFYGIARRVGVPPAGALLGTALLGGNPLFLHLGYSFMTDVPFLALVLGACYCYLAGLPGPQSVTRPAWLVAAGLLAGASFLIRQYGLLVPVAFGLYLVLASAQARTLQWRALLLTVGVPGVMIGGWYLWSRGIPVTSLQAQAAARAANFVFKDPWLHVFLLRVLTLLPLTALMAWGAIGIPRARRWLVPLWAVALIAILYVTDTPDQVWIAMDEPPFVAHLGPFAYSFPQQPFSFAVYGDIVHLEGFNFAVDGYTQARIWSMETWRMIWLVGAGLGALLLAHMSSALWDWLGALRARRPLAPLLGVYLLGAGIFVVSLAFPGDLFDRYALAFVPFVILFVVRGASGWGRRAWAYSLVAAGLVVGFSLLAQADYMEHMTVRWQAAQWMQARVGAVQVGFDWDHWGGAPSEGYRVNDVPDPGYRVEQTFPYTSRLSGFERRTVLAESRADMPPLPSPTPSPTPTP
jgi:hypothetical protein